MSSDYYVYGHFNEAGELRYIGSGRKGRAFSFSQRHKTWVEEFSNKQVKVKIFNSNLNENDARELESKLIKEKNNSDKPLINLVESPSKNFSTYSHGDHMRIAALRSGDKHYRFGKKVSDEIKLKISESKKANPTRYWLGKKRDPELIKKLTDASHTPEAIEKRRIKMTGRTLTDEHKAKISASGIGRQQTEESRKKISDAKKGRPNGLEGKKFSEEHKLKISESRKNNPNVLAAMAKIWETRRVNGTANGYTTKRARSVICLETGEKFRCAKEAAEKMNLSDKHIQACCVGRRPRHGGYTWGYV